MCDVLICTGLHRWSKWFAPQTPDLHWTVNSWEQQDVSIARSLKSKDAQNRKYLCFFWKRIKWPATRFYLCLSDDGCSRDRTPPLCFFLVPFQTFFPLTSLRWQTAAASPLASIHPLYSLLCFIRPHYPPVHSSLSPSHYTLLLSHPSSPPVPRQQCQIFPWPWILHDCSSMHLEGKKWEKKNQSTFFFSAQSQGVFEPHPASLVRSLKFHVKWKFQWDLFTGSSCRVPRIWLADGQIYTV